ncbi:hypothetical protein CHGG_04229 [Chaetomium globosum CBS 148.51]|uniref:AAA+ ATPase domain-containing protein n=1 Tax=Chaetomium globosum (strain ATCC 6205 / CBS 148.51 / DSM 1962 / NBRC 6347 / NRRL 1970) TaxID=306901 RepID=Q2H1W7_CHAGB|nr:uncharacterized protein CHGG_04229 [Chaetomium globosum CBS 148.51]EAQ87610.1 hypothetical protein CHGG_04229 [Chaetomium globosum CBS 148.51]
MAPNTTTSTKKSNLANLKLTLQSPITLDDRAWKYQLPNLPPARELDQRRLIKTVSLVTTRGRSEIVLSFEKAEDNRAIRGDPLNKFLVVSLAELRSPPRSQQQPQAQGTTKPASPLQPLTPRECADYVHQDPQNGRSRRRLSGSASYSPRPRQPWPSRRNRVEDIPDIETADYIFTDGCGLVAPKLAQELARRVGIVFRDRRYTPSVLQIRYRGYKGVVTVDPTMAADKKYLLRMRKSMKKFSGGDDHSFSVVEHSKPYTYGYLNDEVIILLDALGVDRAVIKRKQEEHFRFLADATQDPRSAFRFLCYVNMPQLAERVLMDSLESVRPRIQALVKNEYAKMLNKRDEQKCRILLPKSRLLFGVCDAWGVLKEGECAVKITMDGDGQPAALKGCDVLVTRNPCLHPGDMQKFKVVEKRELAHLVDCIVFSSQGRRPAADLMSGGDLDGDTFFVCWDSDIVPATLSQPAQYPGAKERLRFEPITDDDRLEYFARYNNASLGRVKNLYLDWARARGAMAEQCQELNRLFSQCVDGNFIRIPQKLEKAPPPSQDAPPFILDDIHDAAKQLIQQATTSNRGRALDDYDFDAVELLLSREDIAVSEYELLRMTLRWCRKNGARLEDLLHLFDLNVLTSEERAWVLQQLPASQDIPALVRNAVRSSSLLPEAAASRFQLNHHGVQWKRVFDSSQDRLATFLDTASKTMGLFHRKLLVLRVDERLTLAIYVPRIIELAQDSLVDDTVRLFAFPHTQGTETQSRMSLPTKMTYQLYCDVGAFQLFEGQRANTWIYIARGRSDDSSYRNTENVSDRRRQRQETIDSGKNFDYRVSIALNKFSSGLQRHVGRVNRNGLSAAEIYVISNRDVKSMRTLDLWLEHIETETRLPLFDKEIEEYTVPSLAGVDWDSEPDHIVDIARRQDMSAFKRLETPEQFRGTFRWLLAHSQSLLLRAFDYLLSTMRNGGFVNISPSDLMPIMIAFLKSAPFLAISFGRMDAVEPGDEHIDNLQLEVWSVEILRGYILSANEAQELVLAPLRSFLSRVRGLTFDSFANLVELAALTVRQPEIAEDILLEGFERESARLLPGRPALVRHFVHNTIAIALDHVGEASEQAKTRQDLLQLKLLPEDRDGYQVVEIIFRIDSVGGTPENAAHVRLTAATAPANSILAKPYSIDALVIRSEQGLAQFQCFHPLPSFYERCPWKLEYCGPFTTAKTMFDAVRRFAVDFEDCCEVANQILLGDVPGSRPDLDINTKRVLHDYPHMEKLNASQNDAVQAALNSPVTCLWGPPGTGKTETIVEIIRALQICFDKPRILVTAPTHNAVDNVLRRYIGRVSATVQASNPHLTPLRVSTEIRKVAEDLRKYTCDAMAGQEIHANRAAMDQAKKRVKQCCIIFTTCIGAGIGLLRPEVFDIVIVDEASQQTEPASLVPLVKGCQKAILVGDHVQLRPTVHQHSLAIDFDKSLFERLYTEQYQPTTTSTVAAANSSPLASPPSLAHLMLDTQYRMHPSISAFPSAEFYSHRLRTGIPASARPLLFRVGISMASTDPRSPRTRPYTPKTTTTAPTTSPGTCSSTARRAEDLGGKSKTNRRAKPSFCARVCRLLLKPQPTPTTTNPNTTTKPNTPPNPTSFTPTFPNHRDLYSITPDKWDLPPPPPQCQKFWGVEVSSIDGFQWFLCLFLLCLL